MGELFKLFCGGRNEQLISNVIHKRFVHIIANCQLKSSHKLNNINFIPSKFSNKKDKIVLFIFWTILLNIPTLWIQKTINSNLPSTKLNWALSSHGSAQINPSYTYILRMWLSFLSTNPRTHNPLVRSSNLCGPTL